MNFLKIISSQVANISAYDLIKETAIHLFMEVDENSNLALKKNLIQILNFLKSNQKIDSVQLEPLFISILSRIIEEDFDKNPQQNLNQIELKFPVCLKIIDHILKNQLFNLKNYYRVIKKENFQMLINNISYHQPANHNTYGVAVLDKEGKFIICDDISKQIFENDLKNENIFNLMTNESKSLFQSFKILKNHQFTFSIFSFQKYKSLKKRIQKLNDHQKFKKLLKNIKIKRQNFQRNLTYYKFLKTISCKYYPIKAQSIDNQHHSLILLVSRLSQSKQLNIHKNSIQYESFHSIINSYLDQNQQVQSFFEYLSNQIQI